MGYRLYTNADELLADPEVNTVILTVPNYLHKEMCIKAAKAGKNVITEKPAAMSVQELDEMEAACKEAGVFFHLAPEPALGQGYADREKSI